MESDKVLFIDIEATPKGDFREIAFVMIDGKKPLKVTSLKSASSFLKLANFDYLCGHNIIEWDYPLILEYGLIDTDRDIKLIDTLPLSRLLFTEKQIHSLPKEYKDEDNFKNDPLKDCELTKKLLEDIILRFEELHSDIKDIYIYLMKKTPLYQGFINYLDIDTTIESDTKCAQSIKQVIADKIASFDSLLSAVKDEYEALLYIISQLSDNDIHAHPAGVLFQYPQIIKLQERICYDKYIVNQNLKSSAKNIFGFDSFREFPRLDPKLGEPPTLSQREIVQASLDNESFIAVLPTGGGKTFTFWLPALIKAEHFKSLTVVISPLQALIEDHINSFNKRVANYTAVAISGYMTPLERAESVEKVQDGTADILYIAPESLRSNTIFKLLKNRYIERFVIDEAHCLSTWGRDFRQDYHYIGGFIEDLAEAKRGFQTYIPISCFTATAKLQVLEDIQNYFGRYGYKSLNSYMAIPERKNLRYKSLRFDSDTNKYAELLKCVKESEGATLIYNPTSTKECEEIAQRLSVDTGKKVEAFHSRLEREIKSKILQDFIDNSVDIIVATTAFGMGVDKPDIVTVLHSQISDSLENYSQESGRGARDENLTAECTILYSDKDLNKHFTALNRSKVTIDEINSILSVIKKDKRETIHITERELAQRAGWDTEEQNYETKIKTILLELEESGYIKRGRNRVRFFADSISIRDMKEFHNILAENRNLDRESKELATLIYQSLIGVSKPKAVEVDELALTYGVEKSKITEIINLFKDMGVLGNDKDLSLTVKRGASNQLDYLYNLEKAIVNILTKHYGDTIAIRDINDRLMKEDIIKYPEPDLIESLIKGWRAKEYFIFKRIDRDRRVWRYEFADELDKHGKYIDKRYRICRKILDYLVSKSKIGDLVIFSHKELQNITGAKTKVIDRALLYMHFNRVLELANGRFIFYSPMSITKTDKLIQAGGRKRYTRDDYGVRLSRHYRYKTEAIHIMGIFADMLMDNPAKALEFLRDYFTDSYDRFKRKYKLLKDDITRPVTKPTYEYLTSSLSDEQKKILTDKKSKAIMVLAGPGSGKTKVMIHKMASLLLLEDVKPEQLLMLTFTKSAVREFKERLYDLAGELSFGVEVSTFHSFALKLLAKNISENDREFESILIDATSTLNNGIIKMPHKSVLILDEYQDINAESFAFVKAIYSSNPSMRVIAVGDDDQCIMGFNGADIRFVGQFKEIFTKDEDERGIYCEYELLKNFRSAKNIVSLSNLYLQNLTTRYKTHPLEAVKESNGSVEFIKISYDNFKIPVAIESALKLCGNGKTAILAYENDTVMRIYSSLTRRGKQVRYLIDSRLLKLFNMLELRYFDNLLKQKYHDVTEYTIEMMSDTLDETCKVYRESSNIELLKKVVERYLQTYASNAVSFWYSYIEEIEMEQFYDDIESEFIISTIHKAKGREFENVIFIMSDEDTQDEIRQNYVAMTRAKENLIIISRREWKDLPQFIKRTDYKNRNIDGDEEIIIISDLGDIVLSYDSFIDDMKKEELIAGKEVDFLFGRGGKRAEIYYNNKIIALASKKFDMKLKKLYHKGYLFKNATVEYFVYWYDKDNDRDVVRPIFRVILTKH